MRFQISQGDFSKTLALASKSLPIKPTLPILSNFLINAGKGTLEVDATNLEAATRAKVTCRVEAEGKITVSGKILFEYISQLPEGQIGVELLGEELVVTSKGYGARFATSSAEEFPAIPRISGGIEIELEGESFAAAINRITFAAAMDEGRPILNGVLCDVSKKKFTMVATDGYRLGHVQVDVVKEVSPLKIVIPVKALVEVAKLITEGKTGSSFKFCVAANLSQASFTSEGVEYTTRLIEGEFPNWQKIIPSEFTTRAKLTRDEFMRQMKIAAIFARDSGNIVKLKFEGKKLTITSSTSQVASNEINVDIEMEGRGCEIAFNWRYVIEALAAFEDEEISIELNESLNPGKLKGVGSDSSFYHIIMPVRLQG